MHLHLHYALLAGVCGVVLLAWLALRSLRQRSRQIFRFWDGRRWRGIDPITALHGYKTHPDYNPETTPLELLRGDVPAWNTLVRATREIFGVPAWTQTGWGNGSKGLTEEETVRLAGAFWEYINALKKNGSLPPTPPEFTEPASSAACPTNVSSVCTSTSNAPNSVAVSV